MSVVIREDREQYMQDLRDWLEQEKDVPLEEMSQFFKRRIGTYEEYMQTWKEAYIRIADWIGNDTKSILDLGCGTGLELESIFRKYPHICVTGIDMCSTMLEQLERKYEKKDIKLICGDYLQEPFEEAGYDMVISFESLHHFLPEKKRGLFEKIRAALRPGGKFLEGDYIACCEEEEVLLRRECGRKRKAGGISEEQFVHFDIPLTLEHETELLRQAGFSQVNVLDCIEGATFIEAVKSK
ncbi:MULTISPECIES: class I SAM-dependent methyltransferase [Blautia]|uniref:class I SAM-dependent methyltransferase n=1 Tax=Blautia TaxID=572511 RepID=UPI000BA3E6FD|nr:MULTISPECIES: class I SAM-dependent methyltransferase [Blautia]